MDSLDHTLAEQVTRAVEAVAAGEAVVYPTETVYGLGADALSAEAVVAAFDIKDRDRSNPLSLGVPSVDAALQYTLPGRRGTEFMRRFLPGPVTVVVPKADVVPDVLTAGSDRVGVRVPDHPVTAALLDKTGPLTATSANLSGQGSVRHPSELGDSVRAAVGAIIDTGEAPGTESTVVDPIEEIIHRRGAHAAEIEAWLDDPEVRTP